MGDFWKRWHISLSSWLKDHLCIPMGGNRGASVFTYICLVAVLIFLILISGTLWLGIVFLFGSLVIWLLARFFPGLKLTLSTHINLMMTMLLGFVLH